MFKNVVAQYIGQMRLMNQATTEISGITMTKLKTRLLKVKQP